MGTKEISIILTAFLLFISFVLFHFGRVNVLSLSLLLITSAAVGVIVYKADHISKIFFKTEDAEILVEIRQIREDLYAKVETVREIAEQMAEMDAKYLARWGLYAPNDLDEQIIKGRDELKKRLEKIGSDSEQIRKTVDITNEIIRKRLAGAVARRVADKFQKINDPNNIEQSRDVLIRVRDILLKSENGKAAFEAKHYIESLGVWDTGLEPFIEEFEYFRKTGYLKNPINEE